MELTGSHTEQRFRSSLLKLQYVLIDHPRHADIVAAVAAVAGSTPELFALDSFPENGIDHFVLLANRKQIFKLKASSQDKDEIAITSNEPVNEFRCRLSMINQIMLAVALDMSGQI